MRFILTLNLLFLSFFAHQVFSQSLQVSPTEFDAPWQVRPNPFSDMFTVISELKEVRVEVFGMNGQRHLTTLFRQQKGEKVVLQTGLELEKGLYLVKVSHQEVVRFYKMMKVD